jgi:hypothetical protein
LARSVPLRGSRRSSPVAQFLVVRPHSHANFMRTEDEDLQIVEEAKLSPELKHSARMAVEILHTLRGFAAAQKIPMEQLTAEHIVRAHSELDVALEKSKQL